MAQVSPAGAGAGDGVQKSVARFDKSAKVARKFGEKYSHYVELIVATELPAMQKLKLIEHVKGSCPWVVQGVYPLVC